MNVFFVTLIASLLIVQDGYGADLKVSRIELHTGGRTFGLDDPDAGKQLNRPAEQDICWFRVILNNPEAKVFVSFGGNDKNFDTGVTRYRVQNFNEASSGGVITVGCSRGSWPTTMAAMLDKASDASYELHYKVQLNNGFVFGGKDKEYVGVQAQSDVSISGISMWIVKK